MADSWQFTPLYVYVSIHNAVVNLSFQIVNLCSLVQDTPHKFVPLMVIELKREVSANLGRAPRPRYCSVFWRVAMLFRNIVN